MKSHKLLLTIFFACLLFSWNVNSTNESNPDSIKVLESVTINLESAGSNPLKYKSKSTSDKLNSTQNSSKMNHLLKGVSNFFSSLASKFNLNEREEMRTRDLFEWRRRRAHSRYRETDQHSEEQFTELKVIKDSEKDKLRKKQTLSCTQEQPELLNNYPKQDENEKVFDRFLAIHNHLLATDQAKNGFEIRYCSIPPSEKDRVELYLQSNHIGFFFNETYAAISSNEPLEIDPARFLLQHRIFIDFKTVKDLESQFGIISLGTLIQFDIFDSEIKEFFTNPIFILSKMRTCATVITNGNLDFDSFKEFYLRFQKLISAYSIDFSSNSVNYLNLFTSQQEAHSHQELFSGKDEPKWNTFTLDLTKGSHSLSQLKEECLENIPILLGIILSKECNLKILSKALISPRVIGIQFYFKESFYNYTKLIEIVKIRSFQILTFNCYEQGISQISYFMNQIKNEFPCWNEVKHLGFPIFPHAPLSDSLQNIPSNLKSLNLKILHQNYEPIEGIKNISVKELKIELDYDNPEFNSEELLAVFPNLSKLVIHTKGNLKQFQIKNENLIKIEIHCSCMKNLFEFSNELINHSNLESVFINENQGIFVGWKRNGTNVNYRLVTNRSIDIYNTEFKNFKCEMDELESLSKYASNLMNEISRSQSLFFPKRKYQIMRFDKERTRKLKESFNTKYEIESSKLGELRVSIEYECQLKMYQKLKAFFESRYNEVERKFQEVEDFLKKKISQELRPDENQRILFTLKESPESEI